MSFEQLWDMKPRETLEQKMSFYSDIGAWQAFRQCNYNKDLKTWYCDLFLKNIPKSGVFCEYGCGVAPVTNYLVENNGDLPNLDIHLVDVPGEHLHFAMWRLKKKAPNTRITEHKVTGKVPIPEFAPDVKFDFVTILDVLEHVPNPIAVVSNLHKHMKTGGILVENWIRGRSSGRENLVEAEQQRDATMDFLRENFTVVKEKGARLWGKRQ